MPEPTADQTPPVSASTETGILPRVDAPQSPAEPPDTLPEFSRDGGSITGKMILRPEEGTDTAKDADDSPTDSAATG